MLAAVQARTVLAQAATWSQQRRCCPACGVRRRSKGSYPLVFRTLYGDVGLDSPRLYRCSCQPTDGPATVSPLCDLISSHVAPERLYLEARWSSLVPYAAAAGLLADVLPITSGANRTTVREHALRVAERAEAELGDERPCFIDGCPAEWEALPIPEGRIVAALDGGYVRNWDDRKTNFELIVGRSVPEDRAPRYLGLVHGYDHKPKRRLFEVLKSQGLQANQDVTFLTDGGEEIGVPRDSLQPCTLRKDEALWIEAVGSDGTEAFEGLINVVPEVIAGERDTAPGQRGDLGEKLVGNVDALSLGARQRSRPAYNRSTRATNPQRPVVAHWVDPTGFVAQKSSRLASYFWASADDHGSQLFAVTQNALTLNVQGCRESLATPFGGAG